jgi:hypothetical protein
MEFTVVYMIKVQVTVSTSRYIQPPEVTVDVLYNTITCINQTD